MRGSRDALGRPARGRRGPVWRDVLVAAVATAVAALLTSCAAAPGREAPPPQATPPPPAVPTSQAAQAPSAAGSASPPAAAEEPSPARTARVGSTQRRTFAPTQITLNAHGDVARTSVTVVDTTATGELVLPQDPGVVGWWQSGALAGEAFGSVVLAGHIDSRTQGLGFFVRLLGVGVGDTVELSNGVLRAGYQVTATRNVDRAVLVTGTDTFSQRVPGRLVLITCAGPFNQTTRHYRDNLVVTAEPTGPATPLG